MEEFLIQLGTMSLQASVVVAVVLVLRFLFEKLYIAKKYTMLLWLVPYICMVCPWKFGAPFSFWGKGETLFSKLSRVASSIEHDLFIDPNSQPLAGFVGGTNGTSDILTQGQIEQAGQMPQVGQGTGSSLAGQASVEGFDNVANLLGSMTMADFLYAGLFAAWLAGFLMVGGYCLFSYWKLKKRLICSAPCDENAYYADDIDTAFVVGFIKPKIYLPTNIKKEYADYVIAHEQTHIKRFDPWKKLLALAITCVHWFNPVAWLAFMLFGKDMEMTCDEETVTRLGVETKKDYANALLQLSAAKGPMLGAPLAFGEGNTKVRIKNIVKYRKTIWIVAVLAIAAIAVTAVGFLGKESNYVTLGSDEADWMFFPENAECEITVLFNEGDTTKFVVFPDAGGAYVEAFTSFLKNVEVDANPLSMSRDEDRTKDVGIRIHESVYFYFNEDMSEVWCSNGVKPSYTFKVKEPKALRDFVESQIDSITEAVEATPTEVEETEAIPEIEIQDGYITVGMSGYNHDHSLYETFGVGGDYTLAASYEANLNHDESTLKVTTDELIEVYTGNIGDGDSGFVLFTSGEANDPYSIEAHVARAGWTSIYLIDTEVNDYLLELQLEIREGFGNLSYMVYHFGEQLGPKIPVVINDSVTYSYEADTFDEKAFEIWASGMENYLKDAQLLLSTQDGVLRTEPSNDLELYNAKTILTQIQESMEGFDWSGGEKTEGIENGYPAIPYFAPGDEVLVDATGTSLDYANENIVVFHDYYGLFVYDINVQEIVGAVALEPIGCNYTQGDNYCEVMVDSAGTTVYLHPLQEKEMYVYDVATGVLTQQKYNMGGIEVFDDFGIKEDIVDWDPTVFQTRNIAQVSEENWIHLESGSGLIQDLAVVVTKDGDREAYLKVFENYYRHLIMMP